MYKYAFEGQPPKPTKTGVLATYRLSLKWHGKNAVLGSLTETRVLAIYRLSLKWQGKNAGLGSLTETESTERHVLQNAYLYKTL